MLSNIFGLILSAVAVRSWSLTNLLMTGPRASMAIGDSVALGVRNAMEECKYQFQWDRWNCDLDPFDTIKSQKITREMAYIHAIVSAGIMHTVTRNCTNGDFDYCGCDDSLHGTIGPDGWPWGGCSEKTDFGEQTSADFLDNHETGRDKMALAKLHNVKIGRLAVKKTMERVCKCHGVSGSCATRTCLMKLADFRTVGTFLKEAYFKAEKMEANNRAQDDKKKAVNETRLLYTDDSPNYCFANMTRVQGSGSSEEGMVTSIGTVGRRCSRRKDKQVSKEERQSCKHLCKRCGLNVRKRTVFVSTSCDCKFVWCCEVKCKICRKRITEFICT